MFLVKLRALKGFHPDRGAWHESGEALGRTLVNLLKQGWGRRFDGTRSGDLGRHSSSTWGPQCQRSCSGGGGVENPTGRAHAHGSPPKMEVRPVWTDSVADVGGGGLDYKLPGHMVKKGSTLAFWPSWVRIEITYAQSEGTQQPRVATGKGADPPPRHPEGGGVSVLGGRGGRHARHKVA